jgi:acyl carrier protein
MSAEQSVLAAIHEITSRKPHHVTEIERSHRLTVDLGMDSMDIAELVAILTDQLRKDPFAEAASIADVRTVADLISVYDRAT